MTMSAQGDCGLYVVTEDSKVRPRLLASGKVKNVSANKWHTMKLSFSGSTIKGFVDHVEVLHATDTSFTKEMAGLLTTDEDDGRTTAQFDNLIIKAIGGAVPKPRGIVKGVYPIYK